jgi:hypothetical protein
MATTKLSVSVDDQLVQQVRALVGERGVSAFVTRAVRHELETERLALFLADLEAEIGPADPQMVAEVEAAFDRLDGRATKPAARRRRVS